MTSNAKCNSSKDEEVQQGTGWKAILNRDNIELIVTGKLEVYHPKTVGKTVKNPEESVFKDLSALNFLVEAYRINFTPSSSSSVKKGEMVLRSINKGACDLDINGKFVFKKEIENLQEFYSDLVTDMKNTPKTTIEVIVELADNFKPY